VKTTQQPAPAPNQDVIIELSASEATNLADELTRMSFDNVSAPTVHYLWKTLRFDFGYRSDK